jgi:N-dimethylarginine dimethylaminohydrolase
MLWNNYILWELIKEATIRIHYCTNNLQGVQYLKDLFPNKIVKESRKVKIEARDNALHLDCCFQPVGNDKGIIYKNSGRG